MEEVLRDKHTAGEEERETGKHAGGVEIWFKGIMERGQVDDFVIAWADRGEVENFLLRNGQTCWMGAESGGNHLEQLSGVAGQAGSHSGLPLPVNGASGDGERIREWGRPVFRAHGISDAG